jgi:NADPH2:quinone reductase
VIRFNPCTRAIILRFPGGDCEAIAFSISGLELNFRAWLIDRKTEAEEIKMKAIRVYEIGGPDKMVYDDIPLPSPGTGQALVKIHSIGLNFIDVYFRTGLYKSALPFTPGMEASGTVESIGDGVTLVSPGNRVAYAGVIGAYAEYALVNASHLVALPGDVDFPSAAAVMLQGITAHYLTHSAFPLKKGDTLLLHAAAGGVGLLLIQIAKRIGAKIIGTVSTEEKAALALNAGADRIIIYTREDFELEVKSITGGTGVDVVYDSVGRTTFEKGLNCLKRRGMMVLFGQSSGPVPPIEPGILNARGSLYLTRPGLAHYTATREELLWRAGEILKWISEKSLKIHIDQTYPLKEAARAHQALEGRKTIGKVLLQP